MNIKKNIVILCLIFSNTQVAFGKKTVGPRTVNTGTLLENLDRRLQNAAAHGKLKKVKSLINRGAKVNAQDAVGFTPLHLAALYSKEEVVEYLLENEADVHILSYGGFSPLHNAGTIKIVQLLLDHGIDINIQANNGETPLSYAARDSYILSDLFPEIQQQLSFCRHDVKKFLKEKGAKKDLGAFRQSQNRKRLILLRAYMQAVDTKDGNETVKEELFTHPILSIKEIIILSTFCKDGKILEFSDKIIKEAGIIRKSFCQNGPEGYECTLAKEVFQKLKK